MASSVKFCGVFVYGFSSSKDTISVPELAAVSCTESESVVHLTEFFLFRTEEALKILSELTAAGAAYAQADLNLRCVHVLTINKYAVRKYLQCDKATVFKSEKTKLSEYLSILY